MKNILLSAAAIALATASFAQWQPAGDRIRTEWADRIDPANVLPEYPRPQLVRAEWQNLNGLWNYAIRPKGAAFGEAEGRILVPFAIESALSGVGRRVGPDQELWYGRTFTVPAKWRGRRVLLRFGAVDWKADVWVNGTKVGSHTGGYTAFACDITDALRRGDNDLTVRVWDPTDAGHQPRGKQVSAPEGIWYTPVTGIWQTVWLEPVPERRIERLKTTPDPDRSAFAVEAVVAGAETGDAVEVRLFEEGREVAAGRALAGEAVELAVERPRLWSPDSPFLYDLEATLVRDGKVVDRVRSYTAMRSFRSAAMPTTSCACSSTAARCSSSGRSIRAGGPTDSTRRRPTRRCSSTSRRPKTWVTTRSVST